MNEQPVTLHCQLCGDKGNVAVALAWYRTGRGVQDIVRCVDVDACKGRIAAVGGRWPLREPGERIYPDIENGAGLA